MPFDETAVVEEEKKRLRREYSALRRALSPEERASRSAAVCERFLSLPEYERAKTVLLYAPVRGEVDVWPIFDRARKDGKRVGLPRVTPDQDGVMEFYEVKDRDSLAPGAYGIFEPDGNCPPLPRDMLAREGNAVIMAVPGLAFDRLGRRLGYGGGYYDRYLASYGGVAVGVVYDLLLCRRLPAGLHDRSLTATVTETESIFF